MSATLRTALLSIVRRAGVKSFVTTSGLGHRYVCHVGDSLGEAPFYNSNVCRAELELAAAWLAEEKHPCIFDVGANVGFWATHLAQMLARQLPTMFAFEPVPSTFAKLVESITRLQLDDHLHPIAAAVLDEPRPVSLRFTRRDSMLAQIDETTRQPMSGQRAYAAGVTLDGFASALDIAPNLIKIDVEGSEVKVLRGARHLLQGASRPSILFEYNPHTLARLGEAPSSFRELLAGYRLYYVDDFEDLKRPFGDPVECVSHFDWVCNLFAVPSTPQALERWTHALTSAQHKLGLAA